jgi:putative transposase
VRRSFALCVYGYVVMPEHVHLLLSEPRYGTLADAWKPLKQGVSRRVIGEEQHFWQKPYYDFNICNAKQFVEKLGYIQRNPVKRGLCTGPEDWAWSSFRQYATGEEGRIEIECEWRARKRTRSGDSLRRCRTAPLKPKDGLSGPPALGEFHDEMESLLGVGPSNVGMHGEQEFTDRTA